MTQRMNEKKIEELLKVLEQLDDEDIEKILDRARVLLVNREIKKSRKLEEEITKKKHRQVSI